MAVYDLPNALRAAAWEWGLQRSVQQFRSPYAGSVQAVDLVADRWVVGTTLPPRQAALAGAAEAFFSRLAGGIHRVRLHHQARPVPVGTLRGSPVLSAPAARGNSSIAISNGLSGVNLLANSSCEIDSNSDGVADGLTLFVGGAGDGARTYNKSLSPHAPSHGSLVQYVEITAAGNSEHSGFTLADVAVVVGQAYTFSADIRTAASNKVFVVMRWRTAGFADISDSTSAFIVPFGYLAENRISFTAIAPATAAWVQLQVRGINAVGQYIVLDAMQFERGSSATAYAGFPTLKAGDMLGVGSHLFQVADDVTLNDAGAGTVNVVNRARGTIAGGTAVIWNRPTAEFILPAPAVRFAHQPGYLQQMAFDLEEAY